MQSLWRHFVSLLHMAPFWVQWRFNSKRCTAYRVMPGLWSSTWINQDALVTESNGNIVRSKLLYFVCLLPRTVLIHSLCVCLTCFSLVFGDIISRCKTKLQQFLKNPGFLLTHHCEQIVVVACQRNIVCSAG